MSRKEALTDEKRAAIAAALLSGSGVRALSREFEVSVSTVSAIKSELDAGVFEPNRTEKKEEAKEERRANLHQLTADLLCENLTTLRAQAVVARDAEYLKKYSPESLAVLYGVMADKTLRMLEAAAAAAPLPESK